MSSQPSPWAEHVRKVKIENPELKYNEILKLASASYERKKPAVDKAKKPVAGQAVAAANEQDGSGLLDVVAEAANRVETAVKGRKDIPPASRAVVKQYGNSRITGLMLGRTPIDIQKIANLLTAGKLEKEIRRIGEDKLFHLYAVATLESGKKILIEKNDSINISAEIPELKNESVSIIVNTPGNVTLADSLEATKKLMGGNYLKYTARTLNCQHFLRSYLEANGWMKPEFSSFIMQDTQTLFDNLEKSVPGIRQLADIGTSLGAAADVLLHGAGKPKRAGEGKGARRRAAEKV